jgi:hypothetical protein
MISATSTTQLSVSKYSRKANPRNVIAKSFAKFSAVFQPATWNAHASRASATAAGISQRAVRSGSTSQTSVQTAGISTSPRNAMSHHVDAFHSRAWNA